MLLQLLLDAVERGVPADGGAVGGGLVLLQLMLTLLLQNHNAA